MSEYNYQMINENGAYIGKEFSSPILFSENQRINYESNSVYIISNMQFNIQSGRQSTIFLIVRKL